MRKDATGSRSAPPPVLTSVSPDTATAGRSGATVTVSGQEFRRQSVVRWNGVALPTTYGSATTLTAAVHAGLGSARGLLANGASPGNRITRRPMAREHRAGRSGAELNPAQATTPPARRKPDIVEHLSIKSL
ncbi:MAG: IPT/TIG domain-containing protein [Gemmatimonadetes bacterium]|nr:IPT/TIG domain-containing protein [Gemmatimonadota bacterium]